MKTAPRGADSFTRTRGLSVHGSSTATAWARSPGRRGVEGTLYVYFTEKDELFNGDRRREGVRLSGRGHLSSTRPNRPAEAGLCGCTHRLSENAVRARPAFGRWTRSSDRLTACEVGQSSTKPGPASGSARTRAISMRRSRQGRSYCPSEIAAAQLIESRHVHPFKPMLFNSPAARAGADDYVVGIAVKAFLAATGRKSRGRGNFLQRPHLRSNAPHGVYEGWPKNAAAGAVLRRTLLLSQAHRTMVGPQQVTAAQERRRTVCLFARLL